MLPCTCSQDLVLHDPRDARRRRKTYLIALLDDATRVIPHAAFAFSESAATFLPVFKQAVLRRGRPQRLYVDNGANYRSQHLAAVCASLDVHLIHARPYQPAGKGKIERFFRTVRDQFLSTLEDAGTRSLAALNARWKASTTRRRTAAWTGAHRCTSGPWPRRTCAASIPS